METGAAVPYSGNPNLNASREPGHNFKVMKKFILCLLAVAAGMSAFGQGRVMGVRAGLNVTSIDLSAGSNSFSFDSRASYNVGFAYQQPLLRALPLYLETGLYLTGRGGAVNVADFGFGFDEELSGKVKSAIETQIRMVFFLPIVVAVLHVVAAFPLIRRVLSLLIMDSGQLFVWCLVTTVLAFAVIYYVVFRITSKIYYRIVGNQVR